MDWSISKTGIYFNGNLLLLKQNQINMTNTMEEIGKLSIAEKREIYELLLADNEFQSSFNDSSNDDFLFKTLEKLDKDFQEGKIKTISLESFEARLSKRRNAI